MIRTARTALRPLVAMVAALALLTAACGSDAETATEGDAESTTTTAADTTTTTAAAATDDSTDEEPTEEVEGISVELGEWFISDPAALVVGTNTFALMNVGENPHSFAVARGTSYEELPQKENGAVDADQLGDDFLGALAENIPSGGTGSIDFDLEAGDYVLFCPIEFGPNSHAAAGQVLSVTVG